MKLKSFRLSCKYQVLVFPECWLPTWFTCTRSPLAKDLAAQSVSRNILKLHLLWVVLWPLGFAYFSLHKLRTSVRNALMFAFSDNHMYMTSNTTKSRSFCNFSKWRGELVCGAQISPLKSLWNLECCWPYREMRREKAQECLQVFQYWQVPLMQKCSLKKRVDGSKFPRWHVHYYTLHLYNWVYIYSHQSPWRKTQKMNTCCMDSSLRNILCHFGFKLAKKRRNEINEPDLYRNQTTMKSPYIYTNLNSTVFDHLEY